jgi:endonuclease/exonuclease/phosphatase (EEP) superfamily protein YafD
VTVSRGIGVSAAWAPDTVASDHRPVVADVILRRSQ